MNKEVDYSKRKVFHTVCAILSSDLHERFVAVCKHKGLTVNETLKNFVENYVSDNEYDINVKAKTTNPINQNNTTNQTNTISSRIIGTADNEDSDEDIY